MPITDRFGASAGVAAELYAARIVETVRQPLLLLSRDLMPFMSGCELVTRLDGDGHAIPVLYMSGYPEDDITKHGVLDPAIDFLPKPFQSQQLLTSVRATLDRPLLTIPVGPRPTEGLFKSEQPPKPGFRSV